MAVVLAPLAGAGTTVSRFVLAGLVLGGSVLAGSVLAGSVLAGSVLAGSVLAGFVLPLVLAGPLGRLSSARRTGW